jgi:hypothetical protein
MVISMPMRAGIEVALVWQGGAASLVWSLYEERSKAAAHGGNALLKWLTRLLSQLPCRTFCEGVISASRGDEARRLRARVFG